MINSVDKVMQGKASDLPALFEAPIMGLSVITTLWMTAEHMGDHMLITEIESGESLALAFDEPVTWLQPATDMRAEILAALADEGIDLS